MRTIGKLNIDFNDVWLVVTDQAAYMMKCFKDLKTVLPNMHHVSCLAHSIHRVCEKVREDHKLVDDFLGKMRVVFSRSNDRSQFWKDVTGNVFYCGNCGYMTYITYFRASAATQTRTNPMGNLDRSCCVLR